MNQVNCLSTHQWEAIYFLQILLSFILSIVVTCHFFIVLLAFLQILIYFIELDIHDERFVYALNGPLNEIRIGHQWYLKISFVFKIKLHSIGVKQGLEIVGILKIIVVKVHLIICDHYLRIQFRLPLPLNFCERCQLCHLC